MSQSFINFVYCRRYAFGVVVASAAFATGCGADGGPQVPSAPQGAAGVQPSAARPIDDPVEAATLAARLANDKCKELYQVEPFQEGLFTARLVNGRWHWGEYDPAGPGGFSAEVSFTQDGENAEVEVHYSTDTEADWSESDEQSMEDWGPTEDEVP
jgi:hypothetical protein